MRKLSFLLFLYGWLLVVPNLYAECCTCSIDYANVAKQATLFANAVNSLTSEQAKETAALQKLARQEGLALANERRISEVISQTKKIDSAGFAFLATRLKAEGVIADSSRGIMMQEGFQQSEEEVDDLLSGQK